MQDRHIGDVRVTRIEEQMGPGFPAKDFFPEFDADTFAAEGHWLAPSYYQPESGRLMTSIHSWLLRTGNHTILVDACSGNHKPRPGMPRFDMLNTQYLERLREAGVEPEEIDFVMCTHLHVDHVGWNTRLVGGKWVPTFANARYVFGRTEYEHWRDHGDAPDKAAVFGDSVKPVVDAGKADLVASDARLADEITLVPTPGHSPGHMSVHIRSDGEEALLTGDVAHHPCQMAHLDWSSTADSDPRQSAETRRELFSRFADTPTLVIGGHFRAGHIRRDGAAFKFVALG